MWGHQRPTATTARTLWFKTDAWFFITPTYRRYLESFRIEGKGAFLRFQGYHHICLSTYVFYRDNLFRRWIYTCVTTVQTQNQRRQPFSRFHSWSLKNSMFFLFSDPMFYSSMSKAHPLPVGLLRSQGTRNIIWMDVCWIERENSLKSAVSDFQCVTSRPTGREIW